MKKTISINISRQNFIIEEEAYEKLSRYLENIKRHCGIGADSAEVIADIENSMAEKLKTSLSPYKEVITNEDVDDLIKIMGTTEDFDREVGGSDQETGEEVEKEAPDNKVKRKLYRDTDNAVIAGVASGLGAYFDVDPVLFRIIFCALIFAGGSAFIIYILLWIAMPEAKSAHQKLEMRGQAPTLAAFKNLAKTGKQIQGNWKKKLQGHSAFMKIIEFPLVIINGLYLAFKKICHYVWPIIKFCFGLFLVVFSLIGLGAVGVFSLFLILYNNSAYQISFIPISSLTGLMPFVLMVFLGFLSLAIPAVMLIISGLAILRKKNLMNFTAGLILVGAWMISGIMFSALCLRYFPDVKNSVDNYPLTSVVTQSVDLTGVKGVVADGDISIFVSSDTSTPATLEGRKVELDRIEFVREGDQLKIREKEAEISNGMCIDCHYFPVRLTMATSSDLKINITNGASVFDETAIDITEEIEDGANAMELERTVEPDEVIEK